MAYEMQAPRHPDSYFLKKLTADRVVKLGFLEGLRMALKTPFSMWGRWGEEGDESKAPQQSLG